jgi:hypothetical protein
LDNISIDDDILYEHTLKLSQYDFETDVDVNILGHIFEHSLGEIENVQAEIKGEKVDSFRKQNVKKTAFFTRQNTLPNTLLKILLENFAKKNAQNLELLTKNMPKAVKIGKKTHYCIARQKTDRLPELAFKFNYSRPCLWFGGFFKSGLGFFNY